MITAAFLALAAAAQEPDEAAPPAEEAVTAGAPALGYQVGAGDILDIQVFQEEELSGLFPVDGEGMLTIPLVGRIPVTGLSTGQIVEQLTAKLGASYLVNPQVSVRVETYGSQAVRVLGEVNKPGVIYLTGPTTLQEILAKAGGVKSAKSTQEVTIKNERDGGQQIVNLGRLMAEGEGDLAIRGGDVVYVSEGQTVYVGGEVEKPGSVPFRDGMTVLQALAEAGGAAKTANLREAYILRQEERLPVNIQRILKGREPDIALQKGDQLFVEESVW